MEPGLQAWGGGRDEPRFLAFLLFSTFALTCHPLPLAISYTSDLVPPPVRPRKPQAPSRPPSDTRSRRPGSAAGEGGPELTPTHGSGPGPGAPGHCPQPLGRPSGWGCSGEGERRGCCDRPVAWRGPRGQELKPNCPWGRGWKRGNPLPALETNSLTHPARRKPHGPMAAPPRLTAYRRDSQPNPPYPPHTHTRGAPRLTHTGMPWRPGAQL